MKKIISVVLAVILLAMPLCTEAFASDGEANYDDLVAPCFTYLDSISACISKGILGFVTCTTGFISFDTNKTFVLTCYLQRTDGTHAWENYKSYSETYTENGSHAFEKNWFAPAGHDYRVLSVLEIKNSAGVILETATCPSAVLYK
ncbi:MAG: hypothetical protein IKL10_01580 [Clostridia bacterium]|nr:hypothetical protein [Clostridia bacterium]